MQLCASMWEGIYQESVSGCVPCYTMLGVGLGLLSKVPLPLLWALGTLHIVGPRITGDTFEIIW